LVKAFTNLKTSLSLVSLSLVSLSLVSLSLA